MSTMKTYSLETLTDQYIGKKGTRKRDEFENELRLDLLGQAINESTTSCIIINNLSCQK